MMATMLTVILSAYNRPERLRRALESVLAQDMVSQIQLIVCDNGSPGAEQQALLKDLEEQYSKLCPAPGMPRVPEGFTIFRGPVELPEERARYCVLAAMINRGLWDAARGKYVRYLLDSDEYLPGSCSKLVGHLETHPETDAVFGRVVRASGGQPVEPTPPFVRMTPGEIERDMRVCNIANHNSVVHRSTPLRWDTSAEAWRKADWLFWLRLLDAGFRFENIETEVERYDTDGRMGKIRCERNQTMVESLRERYKS